MEYLKNLCDFDQVDMDKDDKISEEDLLNFFAKYSFGLELEKSFKKKFRNAPTGDYDESMFLKRFIFEFRIGTYSIEDFETFLSFFDDSKKLINTNNFENINSQYFGYNSPSGTMLHYAIYDNNIEMTEFLLKKGADPLIKNSEGFNSFEIGEKIYENFFVGNPLSAFRYFPIGKYKNKSD
jgi:hypothetical protein